MFFQQRHFRPFCSHDFLKKILGFEFSQNFTVEYMENLESVKSIAKSNFKMVLIGNIQGFYDEEILRIFYKSIQLVCKLKNHHNNFPDFQLNQFWENSISINVVTLMLQSYLEIEVSERF